MMKGNKIAVYLLILLGSVFILEGCATSKSCGCGSDINRAYKPKRFH